MKNSATIKKRKKRIVFFLLLITQIIFSQKENLIIGRTTGVIQLKKNTDIRVFGFSKSLSGAIFLPGPTIDITVKDTVNIDFWNIAQGNLASITCDNLNFTQYNKNEEKLATQQPIDHMEHGFYAFTAEKPGTYLYYSPENYPFNIQAGMFGTIIIRDKNNSYYSKNNNEILWCSNELDIQWHTEEIMTIEHDDINKKLVLPPYSPNYFLINGQNAKNVEGLQPLKNKEIHTTLNIRLVNAGLYRHEIEFPSTMNLQLIFGDTSQITTLSKSTKVVLKKGECIELLGSLESVSKKEKIIYKYIDPKSNIIKNKTRIPVFF